MAIFAHLSDKQRQAKDAGDLDSSAQQYSQPVHSIKPTTSPNQHIWFNLICHWGVVSHVPTVKLFKSFLSTLRNSDPSILILPYQAAKQHYSSLTNGNSIYRDAKMRQYFKPYYQKQQYSLSRYFYISSLILFTESMSPSLVDEW